MKNCPSRRATKRAIRAIEARVAGIKKTYDQKKTYLDLNYLKTKLWIKE